jgi:hypothetical protein
MPITWTISHTERLVSARGKGPVKIADFEAYFDNIVVSGAATYRKYFDSSDIEPQLSDTDLMSLGARVSAYAELGRAGAMAIVVSSQAGYELAARYTNLARGERAARIFWEADKARQWLEAQPAVN